MTRRWLGKLNFLWQTHSSKDQKLKMTFHIGIFSIWFGVMFVTLSCIYLPCGFIQMTIYSIRIVQVFRRDDRWMKAICTGKKHVYNKNVMFTKSKCIANNTVAVCSCCLLLRAIWTCDICMNKSRFHMLFILIGICPFSWYIYFTHQNSMRKRIRKRGQWNRFKITGRFTLSVLRIVLFHRLSLHIELWRRNDKESDKKTSNTQIVY